MDQTKCKLLNFDISNLRAKQKELVAQFFKFKKQLKDLKLDLPGARKLKSPIIAFADEVRKTSYEYQIWPAWMEAHKFYKAHNLPELNGGFPIELKWTREMHANFLEMKKKGFDMFMFMPNLELQKYLGLERLKSGLAQLPVAGLPAKHQYSVDEETVGNLLGRSEMDKWEISEKAQRIRMGGYMLFYSSRPVPNETRIRFNSKRTGLIRIYVDEIKALFKKKNWDGLTVSEYYILQRLECEKNRNHDFDEKKEQGGNCTWLLGMATQGLSGIFAGWNPIRRKVEVDKHGGGWPKDDGARPVVVMPLDGSRGKISVAEVPRDPNEAQKGGLIDKMKGWWKRGKV